jgi:hypothetical protein
MNDFAKPQPGAVIRPDVIAAKLQAMDNLEYPELSDQVSANPRLIELLWFIQAMSMRPGGLGKFAADLVQRFPDRVGTRSMLRLGKRGQYSIEQCREVWRDIPEAQRGRLQAPRSWEIELLIDSDFEALGRTETAAVPSAVKAKEEAEFANRLLDLNHAYFSEITLEAASRDLAARLAAFCNEQNRLFSGPWYFPELIPVLIQFMDEFAKQVGARLANTEVAARIFDALEFAWSQVEWVRIEGNSRFGKTESIQAWCEMRPGIARLVKVPCSNSEADLHLAFAEALGMQVDDTSPGPELRRKIEFVIRHARLGFCLDEAHWLLPERFSSDTAPRRLNWVRSELVDRHVPCAIVVTPQAYHSSVARYLKKTRYAFDQILGRTLAVTLPEKVSYRDLLAVARLNFPDVDEDCLGVVATAAEKSGNYFKAVEQVAKQARFAASKAGRPVTISDVLAVCRSMVPEEKAPARRPVKAVAAPTVQRPGMAVSEAMQGGLNRALVVGPGTDHNRISSPTDAVLTV